jgi:hypothetical protein
MTYDEIEGLIGRRLPDTAYGDAWRQWWANTESHSQALAWLRAGWRVSRPDVTRRQVEFRRQSDRPGRSPGSARTDMSVGPIAVPREQLAPGAVRLLEDVAEDFGGDLGLAIVELLNRAALARRRTLFDWFADNAEGSGTSSVTLVREDRDAR